MATNGVGREEREIGWEEWEGMELGVGESRFCDEFNWELGVKNEHTICAVMGSSFVCVITIRVFVLLVFTLGDSTSQTLTSIGSSVLTNCKFGLS